MSKTRVRLLLRDNEIFSCHPFSAQGSFRQQIPPCFFHLEDRLVVIAIARMWTIARRRCDNRSYHLMTFTGAPGRGRCMSIFFIMRFIWLRFVGTPIRTRIPVVLGTEEVAGCHRIQLGL